MGTTHADELFRPRGTGGGMFSKPPVSPVLVRPTVISPTSAPSPKITPILVPELDSPTMENNSTMTPPNLDENPSFIPTECWNIARGQGALNFPFVRFQAKLTVLLSDTIRIVLLRLRDLLEMYVATDLLDCTALTQRLDTIRNVRLGTSVNETTTGMFFLCDSDCLSICFLLEPMELTCENYCFERLCRLYRNWHNGGYLLCGRVGYITIR